MQDKRDNFLSKLELSSSRIKPYEGFIFLCGGPLDVAAPRPCSIREAICRVLASDEALHSRVRKAEDYKSWSNGAVYTDLVSFERHIAELSSVIVLVLESPGSIAELGLFSVIEEFQKKLLVFVDTEHYQSDSFIRLGPVDYLEIAHNNKVECHRWYSKIGSRLVFDEASSVVAESLSQDLLEAIVSRVKRSSPERSVNVEGWLDGALYLCDLLDVFSALTVREVKHLFDGAGFKKLETEIRQMLFLLERVGLVAMEPKGDQRFYVGITGSLFISLSFKEATFDLSRFRSDLLSLYEKSDRKRFLAIKDARSRYA